MKKPMEKETGIGFHVIFVQKWFPNMLVTSLGAIRKELSQPYLPTEKAQKK
jgi:hypothetical protein